MQLRIENADGTTDTLTAASSQITRSLDEQDRAEVQVYRDEWMAIEESLIPRTAKLFLDANGTEEFGGRLDDTDTQDETVRVRINSPEIDAAEAGPTGENVIYQNAGDDEIAADQIMAVPTLMPGTVTEQAPALSYSASYASRSKVLYDLRSMTGSEFRYNADFTVDYVDRLGTDKSGSITLGPAQQNIGQQFSKQIDVRENVTHVQGLGAQSGPDQVQATGVADSYDGGRKIWKRYENKEVYQESRLQNIVDELANEYDGEPRSLEVTCTVYPNQIGTDIALGDSVQVTYSEEDINRTLRIKQLTRRLSESEGHVLDLTLSNRFLTRENRSTKRNDDLQRFNRGYQGFVDRAQAGGDSRQPVTSSLNSEASVVYPDDVEEEITARVFVEGLPYRSYSSGGASGGDHTHQVDVTHPTHSHSINATSGANSPGLVESGRINLGLGGDLTDDWQDLTSVTTINVDTTTFAILWEIHVTHGNDTPVDIHLRVVNEDTGEIYPENKDAGDAYVWIRNLEPDSTASATIPIYDNLVGDSVRVEAKAKSTNFFPAEFSSNTHLIGRHTHDVSDTSDTALGSTESTTSDASGGHTHAANPGVIEDFSGTTYYPSNCDVLVNGTSIGVSLGDGTGTFEQFVDISGQLTPGTNTVEVTSDSLGHIRSTVETELFRRGPQSN
jgi:hypothetical protein